MEKFSFVYGDMKITIEPVDKLADLKKEKAQFEADAAVKQQIWQAQNKFSQAMAQEQMKQAGLGAGSVFPNLPSSVGEYTTGVDTAAAAPTIGWGNINKPSNF